MSLYIYKISQHVNNYYDTYDSAIVVTDCEDTAKRIHPEGGLDAETVFNKETRNYDLPWYKETRDLFWSSWANKLEDVEVKLIGTACENFSNGDIICSSFNAG